MKWTASVCLLLATLIGCRESSAPPGGRAPIQTDAAAYQLEPQSIGYAATIGFVFTNPHPGSVYVVNCGGDAPPGLQKLVDGEWITAWSPIVTLCLSRPIVIAANQQYHDTLQFFAGYPSNNAYPKLETPEIAGEYRLVWYVLRSYDEQAQPFGEALPLEQRVSNSFTLTVP